MNVGSKIKLDGETFEISKINDSHIYLVDKYGLTVVKKRCS